MYSTYQFCKNTVHYFGQHTFSLLVFKSCVLVNHCLAPGHKLNQCCLSKAHGHDLSKFFAFLPSKITKFPFRPMDYSPWSSKNLIDRNWLKKFMQVGVDVTYIHTNFGGRDLSGFRDIATFKNGQISLSTHGL